MYCQVIDCRIEGIFIVYIQPGSWLYVLTHSIIYIYIYLRACSVWNSTEGFVSTGILVAVNGYILTSVDFVKRTLSDIKIVRGIKIADFVLKSFMVQVWVTAEFHRRCTCGKVKNSSRGFLCTFNCQISVLSFFNGKLFWNSQYHLATGQDILCVFIDSFGRFMCFIYFDKLVMHGVGYCALYED